MIKSITMGFARQRITVALADGRRAHGPLDVGCATACDEILSATWTAGERTLVLELRTGNIEVEFGLDPAEDLQQIARRPVVYLDQNHWISLARARHSPDKIGDRRTLDAAYQVMDLARSQKIILPLSADHFTETARAVGHRRLTLAAVMLEMSRGWRMLDPLAVRDQELERIFADLAGQGERRGNAVLTSNPMAIWSMAEPASPRLGTVGRRVVDILSTSSVLLADEHEDAGVEQVLGWVGKHNDLAHFFGGNPRTRSQKELAAFALSLADMRTELAMAATKAGLSPQLFQAWVAADPYADLATLPFVGRVIRATHRRVRDPGDRWERNDLGDLYFLACAAGYATAVVAEKKAAAYLRSQSGDPLGGGTVVSSLPDLFPFLDSPC
ncbi:hypothetical protein [Actinocorallia sp. A-T 12471]|uniref:hypothetical protein n=1 Tax=Actinocorallia sp. A-T 12471 TaxID=3089813 RepID=UPI0029D029EF|nr:hypothetical protein [Actinocorallia sp. A-T 12471]MDX6742579.1 hypothetical protein [Actinocorallia sp. A-T 12471]